MMVLPTEACWLQGKARGIPRMSQRCRNPDSIVITIINARFTRITLMMGKVKHEQGHQHRQSLATQRVPVVFLSHTYPE